MLTKIIFTILLITLANSLPLPLNEYSYILARNRLKSAEKNGSSLNSKEKVVSIYFEKLKCDEFAETKDRFHPSRPLETELDLIKQRKLFTRLKELPKAGNLHVHENQMNDRRQFLEIIQKSEAEYNMLYICDKQNKPYCKTNNCTCSDYYLKYFFKESQANEDGWVKVKGSSLWSVEAILNKTTLLGVLRNENFQPTDTSRRWKVALERVIDSYTDLFTYNKTR